MKRVLMDCVSVAKHAKVIMLDIEGTTTSISFVKEELFPYVRREVKNYLQETWDDPETQADVTALKKQIDDDVESGVAGIEAYPKDDEDQEALISSLVASVLGMMDADRKIGSLKALQGHMWRRAYAEGTLKGHVYEDVLELLDSWKASGKKIVIYSSGSIEAQKLLFGHSCFGDLLQYFSHHFDTTIGSKVESESYRKILQVLDSKPQDVLFVTDLPKEAWAAKDAGVNVVMSIRDGTVPLDAEDRATFPQITSFSQFLDTPSSSSPKKARKGEEKEEDKEEDKEKDKSPSEAKNKGK